MNDEPAQTALTADMQEYRRSLVALQQDAQVDYDKALLTLSGGALGISFAFFRDIAAKLATTHAGFLLGAWIFWALSLTAALAAFYTSVGAFQKIIKQIDEGREPDVDKANAPTKLLNKLAGVLFVPGVFCAIVFLYQNLH